MMGNLGAMRPKDERAGGGIVDIQRELMSLSGDASAMVARVNQFGKWSEHFTMRFPAAAESRGVLNTGAAAMFFYESEFATISRKAAEIAERASEIRCQIEDLLSSDRHKFDGRRKRSD
jgi:hypothetical protein